jgi:hypothetical protein
MGRVITEPPGNQEARQVWNAAERTWDCPCHGSCYRHDGKAIQGLALADLQPKHSGGGAALAGVLASHSTNWSWHLIQRRLAFSLPWVGATQQSRWQPSVVSVTA